MLLMFFLPSLPPGVLLAPCLSLLTVQVLGITNYSRWSDASNMRRCFWQDAHTRVRAYMPVMYTALWTHNKFISFNLSQRGQDPYCTVFQMLESHLCHHHVIIPRLPFAALLVRALCLCPVSPPLLLMLRLKSSLVHYLAQHNSFVAAIDQTQGGKGSKVV